MAPHSLQMPEWLVFLLTLCGVAEGVAEAVVAARQSTAAACVSTVLNDPHRRIAVLGGRSGMYGGSVTRFLGGFRGVITHTFATPQVRSDSNGLAVSRDGSMLLVSDNSYVSNALHVYCVRTGAFLQTIGDTGRGPLQFDYPHQVWVASDGFVFVADNVNHRIQIVTPRYEFHSFVGVGQLCLPVGVCADDDVIVVSEHTSSCLTVFQRCTGAVLRRIGGNGCSDGQLRLPRGLCFMSGHRHIAVADSGNRRVSVFTLNGEFVRHVGAEKVNYPSAVSCSDSNELVVAEGGRIVMFNTSGEIVWTSGSTAAGFTGVAVHGSTIFMQTCRDGKCVAFMYA